MAEGDVDRDVLLPLDPETVGDQGEVEAVAVQALRRGVGGGQGVLVEGPGVEEEAADEGRLSVVDAPDRDDADEVGGALGRRQKYPSRFFCSIEPSRSWSMTRVIRSERRAVESSSMISSTVRAAERTALVQG